MPISGVIKSVNIRNDGHRGYSGGKAIMEKAITEKTELTSDLMNQRIHYLDQVRALAMLTGVFFHAAVTYSTGAQNIWFLTDVKSSDSLSIFFIFSHLFRMALFFFVAGFFANFLIQKRGVKAFLKNRAIRILLPFLVFYPLVMISFLLVFNFMANYLPEESLSPVAKFMLQVMNNPEAESTPPSTAHLWFLYNLMYFCLLAALLTKLNLSFLTRFMTNIFSSGWHLFYLPLFLLPGLYSVSVPVPSPEYFTPQLWSYGYYGLFFFFGWHFLYHQGYLDMMKKHIWKMSLFCVVAFPIFLTLVSLPDFSQGFSLELMSPTVGWAFSFDRLLLVTLEVYLSFYLAMIFLYLGKKLLNKESRLMRYISDASYWIYLVHVPMLLYVQVYLVELNIPVLIKFLISTAVVFLVSIIIYDLLVRYSFIGTMLNGKKTRKHDGLRFASQPNSSVEMK